MQLFQNVIIVISLLSLPQLVNGAVGRLDRGENIFEGKHRIDVAAFYNIYAGGDQFRSIVDSQVQRIDNNHLLDRLEVVYYTTNGPAGSEYVINHPKFEKLIHFGDHGEETQTLALLYDFCQMNPYSKVLYFHDKGSFHYNYQNAKFRSYLDCYVLTPHCIDTLDHHDVCGWRISPHPYIHFSGNFWWARCKYINKLIDPMSPVYNQTFIDKTARLNDCVGAKDRYFAETWIGSAPVIHPADCMNETIDNTYLWGYKFPPAADQFCPDNNKKIPSGLQCGTASTFVDPRAFLGAFNTMVGLMSSACKDNLREVSKRTRIWYGEEPVTYLDWMNSLIKAAPLSDGMLIRFSDSTEIFIAQNGTLRGFPNAQTFYARGLDFGDVKNVMAIDRPAYHIGKPLKSV